MKSKQLKKSILFFWILIIGLTLNRVNAQSDSLAIANADTTHFSANTTDGWQLFNSYLIEVGTDSIQLEIIVRHENNITWFNEHRIGRIKTEMMLPVQEQRINYKLMHNTYGVRIDTSGNVFIRLVSGGIDAVPKTVIPFKVIYRKID